MEDEYEYEVDASYKNTFTPEKYTDRQFNDIYRRNHKLYLASIEWDIWCVRINEPTITEQVEQDEVDTHPFNKFF